MPTIFINYRTGDAEYTAAAIENDLSHRFGTNHVFYAGKSIKGARVYDMAIIDSLHSSKVMIAVIGPNWLTPDKNGRVRLHEEDDWVHREIREALEHGLHILPVLVGRDAERINRGRLPADIAGLADRQWRRYDHRESARCLEAIAATVAELVPGLAEKNTAGSTAPAAAGSTTNTASGTVHGSLIQTRSGAVHQESRENSNDYIHQTTNTGQSGGIGSMSGGSIGTFVGSAKGYFHTGSGNQYTAPDPAQDDTAGEEPGSA